MDVKTACLGLLTFGEASGYEIQKQLKNGCFSAFFDASYGSIYPALSRLTEDGLVSCTELAQDKRPDKKVYRITPRGRLALAQALAEPAEPDRFRSDFLAKMLFCDLLLPGELSELIDQRLAGHEEVLARLEEYLETPLSAGAEFTVRYARAVHEAAIRFIRENRHLLEIEALKARVEPAE